MKQFIIVLFFIIHALQSFCQEPNLADTSSNKEDKKLKSYFDIGINFCNHSVYAARDFGIKEQSYSGSFSYNHWSGVYASISGSYLSETEPHYTSTSFTIGYSKTFFDYLNISTSYSKLFTKPDTSGIIQPLSQSAQISTYLFFTYLDLSASYSYLFGEESGHSIDLSIGTNYSKDFDSFLSSIRISPGISALIGTSNVGFKKMTITKLAKGAAKTGKANARLVTKKNPKGFGSGINSSQVGSIATTTTKNIFGLMSYEFSLPITFSFDDLSITTSYNYAIPYILDKSTESNLPNISYFNIGILYTF